MKGESKYIRMRLDLRQDGVANEATNAIAVCARSRPVIFFSRVAKMASLKKMLMQLPPIGRSAGSLIDILQKPSSILGQGSKTVSICNGKMTIKHRRTAGHFHSLDDIIEI